jgi:cell division protein FtsB
MYKLKVYWFQISAVLLALICAGLFIFLPNGNNDKLNDAMTEATITNQEAINILLDENQILKEHVDKLITQICYIEAIATNAYAKANDDKFYAGFGMQSCIDNLRIAGEVNS